jgi:hypothetical protein
VPDQRGAGGSNRRACEVVGSPLVRRVEGPLRRHEAVAKPVWPGTPAAGLGPPAVAETEVAAIERCDFAAPWQPG